MMRDAMQRKKASGKTGGLFRFGKRVSSRDPSSRAKRSVESHRRGSPFPPFTFKHVQAPQILMRCRNGIGAGYVLRHGALLPRLDGFRIAAGGGGGVLVRRHRYRRSHGFGAEPAVSAQRVYGENEISRGQAGRRPPLARAPAKPDMAGIASNIFDRESLRFVRKSSSDCYRPKLAFRRV